MSGFRENLIAACFEEYERFGKGKKTETADPQYQYVGEYWKGLGNTTLDGRTTVKDKKGKVYRPAWSAAFICFVMKKAGAGRKFLYKEAHCHYIVKGMSDREASAANSLYWTFPSDQYAPKPGDLICVGREYAEDYDYSIAKFKYASDGFFPSHCDIVVDIDAGTGILSAIGGNVSDSVSLSRYQLDRKGRLQPRISTRTRADLPWIGVMACQD